MNKKYSFLYILSFPEMNAIKIGKANDIGNRYAQLKSCWGDADLKNSFSIKLEQSDVFVIEKALHTVFKKWHIKDLPLKDGYTEFFKKDCLKQVVDFVKSMITSSLCDGETVAKIKKGITFVIKKVAAPTPVAAPAHTFTSGCTTKSKPKEKKERSLPKFEMDMKQYDFCVNHVNKLTNAIINKTVNYEERNNEAHNQIVYEFSEHDMNEIFKDDLIKHNCIDISELLSKVGIMYKNLRKGASISSGGVCLSYSFTHGHDGHLKEIRITENSIRSFGEFLLSLPCNEGGVRSCS